MQSKFAKMKAGDRNAFVDPDGYKNYVADREQTFRAELRKQMEAANQAQEDTGGPAGILKDTSPRRFLTLRLRVQIPDPAKFRIQNRYFPLDAT